MNNDLKKQCLSLKIVSLINCTRIKTSDALIEETILLRSFLNSSDKEL